MFVRAFVRSRSAFFHLIFRQTINTGQQHANHDYSHNCLHFVRNFSRIHNFELFSAPLFRVCACSLFFFHKFTANGFVYLSLCCSTVYIRLFGFGLFCFDFMPSLSELRCDGDKNELMLLIVSQSKTQWSIIMIIVWMECASVHRPVFAFLLKYGARRWCAYSGGGFPQCLRCI